MRGASVISCNRRVDLDDKYISAMYDDRLGFGTPRYAKQGCGASTDRAVDARSVDAFLTSGGGGSTLEQGILVNR